MLSKAAVEEFLSRRRKSYVWMKDLTRADLLEEIRDRLPGFRFKRRPHLRQLVGLVIGLSRPRFLFHFDMGGGKTQLVLDLFRAYRDVLLKGQVRQMLVFVPKQVHIGSWESAVDVSSDLVYQGIDVSNTQLKWEQLLSSTADVTCIDYQGFGLATTTRVKTGVKAKLVRDNGKIAALRAKYQFIVLDESHRAGHHTTLLYTSIWQLARTAPCLYALTGTVVGRNPELAWSQFKLVDFGDTLGETLEMFRQGFFTKKANYFGGADYKFDASKKDLLHSFFLNSSITYHESEFSALPQLIVETPTTFRLTPEQEDAYRQVIKGDVVEGVRVPVDGAFHRMREITSGYQRVKVNGVSVTKRFKQNPKLDLAQTFIESIPNDRKFILFYDYNPTAALLQEVLEELKIKALILNGTTVDPRSIEHKFRTDDQARCLLANSASGGEGLNAQVANYVLYYEQPISPITWKQSLKRAHRDGQELTVRVRRLHALRTVDVRIDEYLQEGVDMLADLTRGSAKTRRSLFTY